MKLARALLFGAAMVGASSRVAAEEVAARNEKSEASSVPPYPLRNTSALFLGAEFLGSIVVFAVYSTAAGEPAKSCGWCGTNAFDRSMRRAFVMDDSRTAATASHVLSTGVSPAIALAGTIVPAFSHGHASYALEDSVILLNSALLSIGTTDGTKKLADRRRPAFRYGRQAQTEAHDTPDEEFLSFYSGDTALAFTFASSGATLTFLRGYWTAPYVAIGGGAFALGAGLLRLSADMHWMTDMLTGALAGTAVGFGVPFLLHQRDGGTPRVAVAPSITRDHALLLAAGTF